MSCHDWQGLLAHRLEPGTSEPQALPEALTHLDGCAECRRDALAVDPTLLFRRLAAPAVEGGEVEAMRQAVSALRRGRRLETRSRWPLARWSAAAALAVALSAGLLGLRDAGDPSMTGMPIALDAATAEALARMPLVEELDRPEARLYQMAAEGMQVVMIVDEELDV